MKTVIPSLNDARNHIVKLSETTIGHTEYLKNFHIEVANFFLFISHAIKETFSRDFEFREFMRQCFQIGCKTLPLISVTGLIIGLVLTIQSRPVLVNFGAVSMLPGMVAVSLIRGNGTCYYRLDMCRKNWFRHGCRIRFDESIGAD